MNFLGRLASALSQKTVPLGMTEFLERVQVSLAGVSKKKKIYLGADHAGFELKEALKKFLKAEGYEVEDKGALSYDPDDDYPDFIRPVAEAVSKDSRSCGIVIGFSGEGEAMIANRISGVRAVVYYGEPQKRSTLDEKRKDKSRDVIALSREDNDSNVLALAAGFVGAEDAKKVVIRWLSIPFSGEARHQRRLEKLDF